MKNSKLQTTMGALRFLCLSFPSLAFPAFTYFNPTDTASVPKTISASGFYADLAGKIPAANAVPFEINAALWSDGAWKQRWIILPPGKSIAYIDTTDFFDYPDSTVFVKNFWLERREGDSTSRALWETRFLVKHADSSAALHDWYGFSYRWDSAQSEARLVPINSDDYGLFFYTDARGRRSYKKWRFPGSGCSICHINGKSSTSTGATLNARSVLGFYPAQLKRPSNTTPGINQLVELFQRHVFTGSLPDSAAMQRHFHNLRDPIAAELSPSARIAALDTLARSYLAANCSGCHGYRGIANNAIIGKSVNFDFYRFTPAIEFAYYPTQTFSLNDTLGFTPDQAPYGRAAYIQAIAKAGLDTSAGKPWHMELPPFVGDPKLSITPALLYPGYPSVSEMLYRQSRRSAAWVDSANLRRSLLLTTAGGDSASIGNLSWAFNAPWGSREWEDTLARHGWTIDSVFAATGQYYGNGHYFFYRAPEQMPELGTYVADTVALKILAEWVRNYPSATRIQPMSRSAKTLPTLHGRTLILPRDWSGRVSMSDLQGRNFSVKVAANGTVQLPSSVQAGVFVFRMGDHAFSFVLY